MGNNYDIILIGLVAVFLILRLRSVLGKRTGNERPPARDPFTPPHRRPPRRALGDAPAAGQPATTMSCRCRRPMRRRRGPRSSTTGPGGIRATVLPTATPGVAAIRAADPSFEPIGFTAGARAAFTTIVEAFAKGDIGGAAAAARRADLRQLRGRHPRPRRAQGEGRDHADRLRSLRHRRRRAAGQRRRGHRPLRQRADQRRCAMPTARSSTAIPMKCRRSIDLWTFRRDTKSSDPNWLLIKTESEG